MWNRNCKLISSSERDKICVQHKALTQRKVGNKPPNIPKSMHVCTKTNALAQLSAIYPDSSGESSPEEPEGDNGGADDKLPTKDCERSELSGPPREIQDQCKHEDQSNKKPKEVEHLKNHGSSVGELLSKLRSEDAAKGSKFKKCKARINTTTCVPQKEKGPSRKLQFPQIHTQNTSKILDATHLRNVEKNRCEKKIKGVYSDGEFAVQKGLSVSNHTKVTEKAQYVVKDREIHRNAVEAKTIGRDDHPQEIMHDETHHEQCITSDDSNKTRFVPDGLSLQHKHLLEDKSSLTQLHCKSDREAMMHTQESGNGAFETMIERLCPPSTIPILTEGTSEIPVDFLIPGGTSEEASGRDGAHKSTEQNAALLDSKMRVPSSVTEYHSENVLHPISSEKPESLFTALEGADKTKNFDGAHTAISLYEVSCDSKPKKPCSPALDVNKEGDQDVDVGMVDKQMIDENIGNNFDAEEQSAAEIKASVDDQSRPIISQEVSGYIQTGDAMDEPRGRIIRSIDENHKDVQVTVAVSSTIDQDLTERSKDDHVPLEVCDTLNQDLEAIPSEEGDEWENRLEVCLATLSEPQSTENLDHSSGESMVRKPVLELADKDGGDSVTDIADADLGDPSVSICDTVDEEAKSLVCQESDQGMDGSLLGLGKGKEFSSNSPSPTQMKDCNMKSRSASSIATETVNTSSLSGAKVKEVTGPICQESDQSMDGSLLGLTNALDQEFRSNSISPTQIKDCNLRLRLASSMVTTETVETSSLSGSTVKEVTSPICQEFDQSMDGSLLGLSNALDQELGSNSPSPILIKECNMRLSSASSLITTETIETSSLSGAKVEEVTGPVCQESDQSMDGSFLGLTNALDKEFCSRSSSPIQLKDCNLILSSASSMITSETVDTALMVNDCEDVEKESNKNCFVPCEASTEISRSVSPFEGSNELADKHMISDDIQGVLTFIEREVLSEDFKRPSSRNHGKSNDGQVEDRSKPVLPEFSALVSHKTDFDLQDDTLKETFSELDQALDQDLRISTPEQQEESLSTSHLAEDAVDHDDVLSLVCDTEDLMSSLDDILQDDKQSPTPDEKTKMSDNCKSTSTKDNSTTNLPKPTSSQKCKVSNRDEDRPQWDSKQGCKISIHTRNGNSRYVCKKQESCRDIEQRSPTRGPGPNRNWSASKPFSSSERLALNQRLGAHNAANFTNLDLRQLIRNGPAIQHSSILEHQLQQQHQQQIQRHLQRQLPPALQLRLGLLNNTGQQLLQCTPDDVALIVQRQQLMIEKIIQLYQKQRESDMVMEKQKQIIRHYQRAFLTAKKGGPISMQELCDEGTRPRCYSPRPRSPSQSAGPERQIGRKWSQPYDPEEEQRFVEHQEAKRMRCDVDMHFRDRSLGHPDMAQPPQRNFEDRTETPRRNPDWSDHGAGRNISQQERQHERDDIRNPRFQREERMIISVPTKTQDDGDPERRCVLHRSTPIFPGTRNHPHHNVAGEVFQPIRESHDEQMRIYPGRPPFYRSDVPRQASSAIVIEEDEGFRNPNMLQQGVPYQRQQRHLDRSFQQERAPSVMVCQGRSPSPLRPNWGSIPDRDPETGRIIDYHHSSIHPQVGRADMQQEQPPFMDPGRRGCSSPMYQHPSASRTMSPDEEVSQAFSRPPTSLGRHPSQDVFKAPSYSNNQTIFRAPMRPFEAEGQGILRAPMQDPIEAERQGMLRARMGLALPVGQVIHRTPLRPPVNGSQGILRAPMHPSEANGQGVHRASFRPAVVTISHHWTAQNLEGAPGVLPRLQHPQCQEMRGPQMQPNIEHQQYP